MKTTASVCAYSARLPRKNLRPGLSVLCSEELWKLNDISAMLTANHYIDTDLGMANSIWHTQSTNTNTHTTEILCVCAGMLTLFKVAVLHMQTPEPLRQMHRTYKQTQSLRRLFTHTSPECHRNWSLPLFSASDPVSTRWIVLQSVWRPGWSQLNSFSSFYLRLHLRQWSQWQDGTGG